MAVLTRRQREIYEYIREFVDDRGYSPSLEEIGAKFGLTSVATVHRHVELIAEKGFLRKVANSSRSLEPVDARPAAASMVELPVLGAVAAGVPIEAFDTNDSVSVPAEMVRRRGETFVLRVRGDSMIDEQIRDGDQIVVERASEARKGEMVVAMVRGSEATLKRFYRRGSKVVLEPANSAYRPLELPAGDVEIRGIVRGLLRTY
ncbi:MAG: transcriptional repressor LexA [Myxococcota bacterium]|jgi:repressor LexA